MRDPRVAISVVDFRDPYQEAQLRGRVVERRSDSELRHMRTQSRTNTPENPFRFVDRRGEWSW